MQNSLQQIKKIKTGIKRVHDNADWWLEEARPASFNALGWPTILKQQHRA